MRQLSAVQQFDHARRKAFCVFRKAPPKTGPGASRRLVGGAGRRMTELPNQEPRSNDKTVLVNGASRVMDWQSQRTNRKEENAMMRRLTRGNELSRILSEKANAAKVKCWCPVFGGKAGKARGHRLRCGGMTRAAPRSGAASAPASVPRCAPPTVPVRNSYTSTRTAYNSHL